MAWGWDDSHDAHRKVYGQEKHEGKLSHELIAGAASFGGMKVWEDHQRKQGKPVSHAFAKEALAGVVGSQVDRIFETKGLDEVDKHKAKHHAQKNAEQMYDHHYVEHHGADQYDPNRYGRHHHIENSKW